ncbi:hypothetical protein SNEBB_010523 [Seison nebaliae]|nr:hypothetical protein SNEBB_010523 [Seison nebaliae]
MNTILQSTTGLKGDGDNNLQTGRRQTTCNFPPVEVNKKNLLEEYGNVRTMVRRVSFHWFCMDRRDVLQLIKHIIHLATFTLSSLRCAKFILLIIYGRMPGNVRRILSSLFF